MTVLLPASTGRILIRLLCSQICRLDDVGMDQLGCVELCTNLCGLKQLSSLSVAHNDISVEAVRDLLNSNETIVELWCVVYFRSNSYRML